MATYKYYQPEYVKNFQCDGQKCSAYCCKNWKIIIDKKTYKKYSHLKPKSAAKEIMRNLKKIDNSEDYQIKLDENFNCPFLTEDNLCYIQKNYGEDFLSETCTSYPRRTWNFEDFYERSLSLTCPVVAEMVLLETAPLKFEWLEVSEKIHNTSGIFFYPQLPTELFEYTVPIQETAIKILQERTLTIDQRLLMLGLYCDRLDELVNTNRNEGLDKNFSIYKDKAFEKKIIAESIIGLENINELKKINLTYSNSEFLQSQAAYFSTAIKFNAANHLKIILSLLETLYGNKYQPPQDRKLLEAVIDTLKIQADENYQIKISDVVTRYTALNSERQKFLQKFLTVFENYLVHELFLNLYPFSFYDSLDYNFEVFATVYKMLEFLTFSSFMQKENYSEQDLISEIRFYANRIDHNPNYIKKISDFVKQRKDIVEFMQSTLQV